MTASNDAAEAGPSTTKPAVTRDKKGKLIRPRGKRGGKKKRRPSATPAAKAAAKGAASSTSSSAARTQHSLRIAHFHRLEKEKARLLSAREREEEVDDAARMARLAEIEAEQEALGGLDAYQDDSLTGSASHRGGESGKWLAQQMVKQLGGKQELTLLDIGALTGTSYSSYSSWIHATSIDVNPRSEHVIASDYFDYPFPTCPPTERFDVVCLSLVLNFIGDLSKRGEALVRAHGYLKPRGWLYLVLPLACVSNSRYLDHERLRGILGSCGWDVVVQDDSKKLTRWLVRRKEEMVKGGGKKKGEKRAKGPWWDGKRWKKEEIKVSATANNFCIKVDQPEEPSLE